jgi:hypothetical protein
VPHYRSETSVLAKPRHTAALKRQDMKIPSPFSQDGTERGRMFDRLLTWRLRPPLPLQKISMFGKVGMMGHVTKFKVENPEEDLFRMCKLKFYLAI